MIEIVGKPPGGAERNRFEKIGALTYFIGDDPSISVWDCEKGAYPTIWAAVDTDDNDTVRYLVFPVEPPVVFEYLEGKISNAELSILSNSKDHFKYYIVDIDDDMNATWLKVHNEDIPPQYAELFKETDFYKGSPDEAAIREYLATFE